MHPAVAKFKNLPSLSNTVDWQSAPDTARKKAQARATIIKHLVGMGGNLDAAIAKLSDAINQGLITPAIHQAIAAIGKLPSRATVYNWYKAYKEQGMEGLLPNNKGRAAKQPAWAMRALELYHAINSPSFAQVADQLIKEGYQAKDYQVRRFINSLPHELGPQSPYRIGNKLYREKHKDHLIRSTDHIPPGFLYNGDGHTLDVYLAHPSTGKAWRAELTAFQDVGSRCIVGWELGEAESSISTLTALTRSIRAHHHIPSMLYIDNGSGYKSQMMADECTGVYAQFDIDTIFAIPGNARAKWIERFFLHMEDRVGKRFASYCGRDHTERHKQLVLKEVRQGKRSLPTVDEWVAEFKEFLEHYHNSPHPEIKGKTRMQVWEEGLQQDAPPTTDFVILPREKVNVRRGRIRLHNRYYSADFLHQFNGQELVAGYDLHDDTFIHLYEKTGEFIMVCQLKNKSHAIPTSRIEQKQSERLVNQEKRLLNHVAEKRARAAQKRIVDVESVEALAADTSALTHQTPQTYNIDINDFAVDLDEYKPEPLEAFILEDDE
ncbi:Mu transposase C-terminal domain-containing protein [Pseudoalteromonas 'SMAR']|uniref:Mu transposase C-terminal domain-containing protein n=1 Tax=Pseudoalteromonas 'SMAR' TaxID=3416908 RepID=UPI003AF31379